MSLVRRAAACGCLALLVLGVPANGAPRDGVVGAAYSTAAQPSTAAVTSAYTVSRARRPARSIVKDSTGAWVATFTDGARSVALAGPARRFTEASAGSAVNSRTYVRLLDGAFGGTVDLAWLESSRADTSPDVLARAMQFLSGKPDRIGGDGLLASADASYGPVQDDGARQEGSDWNDFQGVAARYGTVVDRPEPGQHRSLDCSGFVRMVWGRRSGIPMGLRPDGRTLPRRAVDQAASALGVTPVVNTGVQVTRLESLQPGDLVFFDASSDDGSAIDHVGIYLGRDTGGRHRFVSSRKSADGPTMGDFRGASVLDGTGYYAKAFRATRRL